MACALQSHSVSSTINSQYVGINTGWMLFRPIYSNTSNWNQMNDISPIFFHVYQKIPQWLMRMLIAHIQHELHFTFALGTEKTVSNRFVSSEIPFVIQFDKRSWVFKQRKYFQFWFPKQTTKLCANWTLLLRVGNKAKKNSQFFQV